MILSAQTTTTSTKYGSKKIASKGENDWRKKDEWRTERGSDVEVVIPVVIAVVLRVNDPGKQARLSLPNFMSQLLISFIFCRQI